MKTNQADEGRLSARGEGLGTVTEEMVRQRASELAVINGRSKHNILQSDLVEARRELTGKGGATRQPEEEIPESERWDPVPGSSGKTAPTVAVPDEQTVAERLVEEGVEEAEQEQMIRATRQSLRRERKS